MKEVHKNIEKIIRACLKGDRNAERILFDATSKKVLGICRRYAKNKYEADDMFQNAMINIFRSLSSFDPNKGNIEQWVHRIAVNASLKHLKKEASLKYNDIDEGPEIVAQNIPLEDNLALEELLALIDQLPAGKKAVFNLFAIEGYGHKEIAEMLGITEGTSKSQYAKAKDMLQTLYLKFQHEKNIQ